MSKTFVIKIEFDFETIKRLPFERKSLLLHILRVLFILERRILKKSPLFS